MILLSDFFITFISKLVGELYLTVKFFSLILSQLNIAKAHISPWITKVELQPSIIISFLSSISIAKYLSGDLEESVLVIWQTLCMLKSL